MKCVAMKTLCITVCCLLSFAHCARAGNPTWMLHPDEPGKLKQAGIHIAYRLVVNDVEHPEYAFTITAKAPEGVDALDAMMSINNSKGLVAMQGWSDSGGKCVSDFTVGKQALKDAGFMVQLYRGKRTYPFSASGRYVLSLAEFASDQRYCSGKIGITTPAKKSDLRIVAPIQRDGPWLTIEVTPKSALSNHHYDFHITVEGRANQHFQIRNSQPITRSDIRLADLNSDGFLDIMIVGGVDHRGQDWYKTLIYDEGQRRYRWINDELNSID
ncbi:hypothetical protein [Gimesia aquarii]|uniref:FG-GAP repeat protein n=1 Tax=Gimesia aquarii TaxID=2527964 RepID=A0A517X339_9PLAN|nr:hypothetical protein [Gimesia aquarii]QDU11910.1 hypothetical protein V202x_53350 [Gimesia aquarii]